jgi:hypothetical protein
VEPEHQLRWVFPPKSRGVPEGAPASFLGKYGELTVPTTVELNDGQWYHLAVTYKKAGKNGYLKWYIDGKEIAAATTSPQPTSASANLYIGVSSPRGIDEWFKGLIDELALFNHTLSAEEIKILYDSGASGTGFGSVAN